MSEKFPGPYRNSVPQDLNSPDPMIVRVPVDHTGVGARRSALPKNVKNDMTISHVGGTTAGGASRKNSR